MILVDLAGKPSTMKPRNSVSDEELAELLAWHKKTGEWAITNPVEYSLTLANDLCDCRAELGAIRGAIQCLHYSRAVHPGKPMVEIEWIKPGQWDTIRRLRKAEYEET